MARLAQENQVAANRYAALIRASNSGAWEYDASQREWGAARNTSRSRLRARGIELCGAGGRTTAGVWRPDPSGRSGQAHAQQPPIGKNRRGSYDQRYGCGARTAGWAWIGPRPDADPTRGRHVHDRVHARRVTEICARRSASRKRVPKYAAGGGHEGVVWFMDATTLRFLYVSRRSRSAGFTPRRSPTSPSRRRSPPAQRDGLRELCAPHAAEVGRASWRLGTRSSRGAPVCARRHTREGNHSAALEKQRTGG
jgi:hypothetical protein